MGNVIRIKEGGLPRSFNAAKLRTNLQGGGNCLWIPKESVPVASKFITENGTYLAADEGLHGFSSLNVSSQPDYVVGNKGGKTYYVHKGGPTGSDLVYEEIPEYIKVTKLPIKRNYRVGQKMDYRGIEVTAYDTKGRVWTSVEYPNGVIPFDELVFQTKNYYELDYEFIKQPLSQNDVYKSNRNLRISLSGNAFLIGLTKTRRNGDIEREYYRISISSACRTAFLVKNDALKLYECKSGGETQIHTFTNRFNIICSTYGYVSDAITVKHSYDGYEKEKSDGTGLSVSEYSVSNYTQKSIPSEQFQGCYFKSSSYVIYRNRSVINDSISLYNGDTFKYDILVGAEYANITYDNRYNQMDSGEGGSRGEKEIAANLLYSDLYNSDYVVSWQRPGDGKMLDTSFGLEKSTSSGGNGGGGTSYDDIS